MKDVFPDGVNMPNADDATIVAMPARISYLHSGLGAINEFVFSVAGQTKLGLGDDGTKLDYISVLPPTLYGEDYTPPASQVA